MEDILSTPSENRVGSSAKQDGAQAATAKTRTVLRCNFSAADRLANEDARALKAMHEAIAQQVAGILDAHLGSAPEVKFAGLTQLPAKDHIAEVPPLSYVVPEASGQFLVEFDLDLAFPTIELLMGGTGDALNTGRDLTEIEEEIMRDVVQLVLREVEDKMGGPGLEHGSGPSHQAGHDAAVFPGERAGNSTAVRCHVRECGGFVQAGSFHAALQPSG